MCHFRHRHRKHRASSSPKATEELEVPPPTLPQQPVRADSPPSEQLLESGPFPVAPFPNESDA